jgi:Mitochondrial carrier protein
MRPLHVTCSTATFPQLRMYKNSSSSAGSIGGTMEACFLQPIDTIKTRLQLDSQKRYTGVTGCWVGFSKSARLGVCSTTIISMPGRSSAA